MNFPCDKVPSCSRGCHNIQYTLYSILLPVTLKADCTVSSSYLNVVVDDCVDEAVVVAALVDEHRHVVAQVPHDVALLLRELLDQLGHSP